MRSLWLARVLMAVLAPSVLVVPGVAARRWISSMVAMMVQRPTMGVCTAGVKWGALEIWSHAMTMNASASG